MTTIKPRTPHEKAEARQVAHEIRMARKKLRREREAAKTIGTAPTPNMVTSRAALMKAREQYAQDPSYRPHQGELECARRAYPGLSRSTALREFRFFRDNPRS